MEPHRNPIPAGPQTMIVTAAANGDALFAKLFPQILTPLEQQVIGLGGADPEAQCFQLTFQPLPLLWDQRPGFLQKCTLMKRRPDGIR